MIQPDYNLVTRIYANIRTLIYAKRLARISVFRISVLTLAFLILAQISVQASIVLRLVAVNPSKTQVQRVPIKAYLPKEVKPEDILDKADLDAIYDTQQGSYFVYGEYDLKPEEVVEKEIEIRDIWVIPSSEIESLRSEMIKISEVMKNTEFAERVSFLKYSIESKLNQVVESQRNSPPNPARHISDYRENIKTIESVKTDLTLARSLLSQVKPVPAMVIWRLIIAIVIFLGLLGISFYFIWQKQVKTITRDDTFFVPKEDKDNFGSSQTRKDEGKRGDSETNIEDILKGEPKEES